MTAFSKVHALAVSGCAAIGLMTLSASARAEVLFDSLSSQNSGVVGDSFFETSEFAASFNTGASAFRVADVALLLNSTFSAPGDMFTVSLGGGTALADVMFEDDFGNSTLLESRSSLPSPSRFLTFRAP